jgi:thiol-disulfide isomerase/thioredoxin
MPRKRQTKVGKVDPIDVRSKSDIGAFEGLLGRGPLTIVLVYADWCGHCQTFKQNMWNEVSAMPNKKVNTASVHYDMVENTSLKNAKIEGYPSLLLVGTNKQPASFKENGAETNALPTPKSITELKSMVNTPVNSPVSNANTVATTVVNNATNTVNSMTNTNMNSVLNTNTNRNASMNINVNRNTNSVNSYVPADPETLEVPDTSVDIPKTATVLPQTEVAQTEQQRGGRRQQGGSDTLIATLLRVTAEAGHVGGLILGASEYAGMMKRMTRKRKAKKSKKTKQTKKH